MHRNPTLADVQVPFRRIALTNGRHFDVYDTSGPQVCAYCPVRLLCRLLPVRLTWALHRSTSFALHFNCSAVRAAFRANLLPRLRKPAHAGFRTHQFEIDTQYIMTL
jgi:hypothetical protein